ncbi:MAG: 2-hydroxyacyl-CoA dehydratase, partial [Candidatus Hydrogenedentes bacterium]|nr:2-hydroxyacyl-CoA dehydratase [Candidatus Hydrogenedentota bacterium]
AAHGMRPSRILPRASGEMSLLSATAGVCPYAAAFVDAVRPERGADAVVFTTACDQMRRASELADRVQHGRVFLMNVPSTWQTVAAQELYMSELQRLGRFLVQLGGSVPSAEKLSEVMRKYGATRSSLRSARGRLSPRQYAEAIADFHREGAFENRASESAPTIRGVPVALVGGPLLLDHLDIFDVIEREGGYVALNATGSRERTLPAPFDRRALRDTPFLALADAYFGTIPDAFRRPNDELYRWLKREIAETGARGIIFWRYLWCDIWHAEAQRMKEGTDLPLLIIDTDGKSINGRTVSRIQSFFEVVR